MSGYDYTSYVEQITKKIIETEDEFIIKTITSYCGTVMQQNIPKRVLINALTEYQRNHPEEFERMVSEYEEELENS